METLHTHQTFDANAILPQDLTMLDFFGAAYQQNSELSFMVDFIMLRTLRIRMFPTSVEPKPFDSPMLVKEPS